MTVALLIVALAALALLVWAARRARSSGVIEDPHRPPVTTAAPPLAVSPAAPVAEAERLVDYLVAKTRVERGVDLERDTLAKKRLLEAATLAIEQLRRSDTVQVNLPFLWADEKGPGHLKLEVHRAELDVLVGRRER
jgi:Flp pilus assembly protein CpaB